MAPASSVTAATDIRLGIRPNLNQFLYRFWRDLGYAIGALSSGLIADFFGFEAAISAIGGLALLSGVVFAILGHEEPRR